MSQLPPGHVWKWKMKSCFSPASKHTSASALVSSSHAPGSGLPPSRKVVFSATIRDSAASLSASSVFSALRGRNETHSTPRMRSLVVAASITTSLRSKESSCIGTP